MLKLIARQPDTSEPGFGIQPLQMIDGTQLINFAKSEIWDASLYSGNFKGKNKSAAFTKLYAKGIFGIVLAQTLLSFRLTFTKNNKKVGKFKSENLTHHKNFH